MPITAQSIKNTLLGNGEKKYFIMEAFQVHNTQMKKLVGIDIAPATLTRYKTAYDHVNNFIIEKAKTLVVNGGFEADADVYIYFIFCYIN